MAGIRAKVGDTPRYQSFDVDGIDPCFAGGTGTPEIDGLTVPQALKIVRVRRGLNLVGANLQYEMLCVLPGVPHC